jgi:hypothetical protein
MKAIGISWQADSMYTFSGKRNLFYNIYSIPNYPVLHDIRVRSERYFERTLLWS